MPKPHQVNLIMWVNDGKDTELVDSLNESLRGLAEAEVIYDEEDQGWSWMGVKVK